MPYIETLAEMTAVMGLLSKSKNGLKTDTRFKN